MKNYPKLKVLFGFTICPSFAGVLIAISVAIHGDPFIKEPGWSPLEIIFWSIIANFSFAAASALIAVIFYAIPSFLLSVMCVSLKLKKNLIGLALASLFGGLGAFFWAKYVFPGEQDDFSIFIFGEKFFGAFFWGAISAILMGFFVLPHKILSRNDLNT
jgi:hypothetical protein